MKLGELCAIVAIVFAAASKIAPTAATAVAAVPCPAKCAAAGHCCVGDVSSYNLPSCAMGCTIAGATASQDACEAECAAIQGNPKKPCDVTFANHTFQMCETCPAGCASAAPDECQLGCAFAHGKAPPRPLGACADAMDCSLNGDCVGGRCVCDTAWNARADCSALNFAPTPKGGGYRNGTQASWGGYPLRDDATGTWHLFHAQMLHGCPLGSWTTNSVVARSTAPALAGPYAFREVVVGPFAHNPTIRRAPDGTYVLFYIGGWPTKANTCRKQHEAAKADTRVQPAASPTAAPTGLNECGADTHHPDRPPFPGPTGDCCGPPAEGLNAGCGLRMAWSDSLLGPWATAPLNITVPAASYANATAAGVANWMDCAHTNPPVQDFRGAFYTH